MTVDIELDVPVCRGDLAVVPNVEINCYLSEVNEGEFDHYKEGQQFAEFVYSQCQVKFFDGLLDSLKKLNGDK